MPRNIKSRDGSIVFPSSQTVTFANPNSPGTVLHNVGIEAVSESNNLVIRLKQADGSTDPNSTSPAVIGFHNSTATTGSLTQLGATAATSLTVANSDLMGSVNNIDERYYIYAINNSGTIELAISGWYIDDTKLQSTTAVSGANNFFTLYSTTARSNVPVRLIGTIIAKNVTNVWPNPSYVRVGHIYTKPKLGMLVQHTSISTVTANTAFNYDTVISDNLSIYSSGTATIPFTDFYNITAQIEFNSQVTTTLSIRYTEPGSSVAQLGRYQASTYDPNCNVNGLLLRTGTTVHVESSTGGTTQAATGFSYFMINN